MKTMTTRYSRTFAIAFVSCFACAISSTLRAQEQPLPLVTPKVVPVPDANERARMLRAAQAPAPSAASAPTDFVGHGWIPLGPGSTLGGQLTLPPDNAIAGAIQAIALHPTDPEIIYLGAVGGGVWKTCNARDASPIWQPLMDTKDMQTLNVGALEFDPTDATRQSLVVGTARTSSYGAEGGALIGVLRTTDGGTSWSNLGASTFADEDLTSVAARGSVLLAASDNQWVGGNGSGLFRSTNTGASFTLVSGGSGLSAGPVSDLVGDPAVSSRFFAAVRTVGIFLSSDTGATWSNITGTITGITANTTKVEMAMVNNGVDSALFVGVINSEKLESVWRSTDSGATWTRMDTPNTGGQGQIHFGIAADPSNTSLVYVGGQNGRFRGDASLPLGSQFTTIEGAHAGNTKPHADTREMFVDADGNLVDGCDGGIVRLSSPQTNTGKWGSVNGNLAVFEAHDVAYDSVAHVAMIGTQDNGTHIQNSSSSQVWKFIAGGDGGDVAIDDSSSPGQSIRYGSSQELSNFFRKTYDSSNKLLSTAYPALTLLSGSPAIVKPFATPVEVNKVAPTHLAIGGSNSVYESLDKGNSVTALSVGFGVNDFSGKPLAYGGREGGVANPDVLYFGSGSTVRGRTTSGGAVSATPAAFPGGTVQDIVLDSNDWHRMFVCDASSVYVTPDSGASWQNITGNLTGVGDLHSLEYFNLDGTDCVAAGTGLGVYVSFVNNLGVWSKLGYGMPNAVAYDLSYNATDNVLVVGTMGRGAYMMALDSGSNLAPYRPGPWSDGIVVTTVKGTNIDSPTLLSSDSLYLDYAVKNNGNVATAATYKVALYVDGLLRRSENFQPPQNPGAGLGVYDYPLGKLLPGIHKIQVIADTDNVITETSEGDNEYTKCIEVRQGNDNFASAQALSGNSGTLAAGWSNVGMTKESGEPNHAGDAGGHSVWYQWKAPHTGTATIDTFGSSFDTLLAVYTGSTVDGLTEVASNDEYGGGSQSLVTFNAVAGTVYRIAVDGYVGATGNITLNYSLVWPEIAIQGPAGANLTDGSTTAAGFGSVLVNESVTKTFTVKNTGTADLTGLAVTESGANSGNFTVEQPLLATVAPGASTTFTVTFMPSAIGKRRASIHVSSNDSNENPFDIPLTGIGIGPEIAIRGPAGANLTDGSLTAAGFGSVVVNGMVTKTFTISNTGNADLANLAITESGANQGNFIIAQPLVTTVAPGSSTTFMVTFKPSATGRRRASIHVASNDSNENPFDIPITGIGLAAAPIFPANGAGFASWLGLDSSGGDGSSPTLSHLETTTSVEWVDGHKYLTIAVRKPAGGLDFGCRVEVSPNLLDWYSGRNHTTVMQDDAEWLRVRDNTPLTPNTKRFIRLK